MTELSYVGHLLTDQGITPGPTKTATVRLMAPPEDKHGVQRFLGMTNYYMTSPDYSKITAPLRQLLQGPDWTWQEYHTATFNKLEDLSNSPHGDRVAVRKLLDGWGALRVQCRK